MPTVARDWLIDGAIGATTSEHVLAGTCERLIAGGVPITRADAYVRTLHPQFIGRAFTWHEDGVHVAETQHDDVEHAETQHDNVEHAETEHAHAGETMITRTRQRKQRLRNRFTPADYRCTFTRELEAAGVTDVISLPLEFTSGEVHVCTFSTTRAGGFTDADVAAIEGVQAPLSRVAEILALRRIATNVLTAYVGRDAGARVLAGKIRRGDTELIETAIYFSDMRGFSTVSSDMTPHDVIAILNQLFDCQLPAIERHGGEVLKFMGDGLLAIFPPGAGGLREACDRAFAATRDALAALDQHNQAGNRTLRFGIALHVGEVAYGNIGGEWRLDFTCIGRAVNLAARLEQVTAKTGHDVLASADFVAHQPDRFERVADFMVKGFAEPVAAFARIGHRARRPSTQA